MEPLLEVDSGDAHHARAHHTATLLGPLAIPAPAPRALSGPSPPLPLLLRAVLGAIIIIIFLF
jgi:hypothetical protein